MEGIVLAADSRVTLTAKYTGERAEEPPISVNFDNATKLLKFSEPDTNVGVVTYGEALIGQRTASSFVPEFENWLASKFNSGSPRKEKLTVKGFTDKFSEFYKARWDAIVSQDYQGKGMAFMVGGYDEGAAYGSVFTFDIPNNPEPQPRNPGDNDFGITWGGQGDIASRILRGFDPAIIQVIQRKFNLNEQQTTQLESELRRAVEFPIPYMVLPLQDCVDLARHLIDATMITQQLAVGVRGVGGPIDVAVINRTTGLTFIQEKQIR